MDIIEFFSSDNKTQEILGNDILAGLRILEENIV